PSPAQRRVSGRTHRAPGGIERGCEPGIMNGNSGGRCSGVGVGGTGRSVFRPPTTHHRSPTDRIIVTVTLLLLAGCDVTAPDRTDFYNFRLQPENAVFSWPADRLPV